jgi:hypothetical protein
MRYHVGNRAIYLQTLAQVVTSLTLKKLKMFASSMPSIPSGIKPPVAELTIIIFNQAVRK